MFDLEKMAGRSRAWAWLGVSAWLALFLVELVALSCLYDSGLMTPERTWDFHLLRYVNFVPRIAIAIVSVLVIAHFTYTIRFQFPSKCPKTRDSERLTGWSMPLYLVAHLAFFAIFARLSGLVIEGNTRVLSHPSLWVGLWALSGLSSFVCWAAIILPMRTWAQAARSKRGFLLFVVPLGFVVWWISYFANQLWVPLSYATYWSARLLLSVFFRGTGNRLSTHEMVLGNSTFSVQIAPQCAGYEGIGLILALLILYLWWFRNRLAFPRALLLLPLGTVAIWLANVLRIVALVLVGTYVSSSVAAGGLHSQMGWVAFNGVGLGLISLAHRLHWFSAPALVSDIEPKTAPAVSANPAAAYLMPLIVLLATMMVTMALTSGFDRYYPLRVVTVGATLWWFRRDYAGLHWTGSWHAIAIGGLVFVIWVALEYLPGGDRAGTALHSEVVQLSRGWAFVWCAFRVIGSVITVPCAEELAFRGFFTRWLIARDFTSVPPGRFTWLSFLVSSVCFGALHGRILAGTIAGMFYALALYRRKELSDAIVAHATTNGLIALSVFVLGTWGLWL